VIRIIGSLALVTAASAALLAQDAKSELEKLRGTWAVVKVVEEGKDKPEEAEGVKLVFDGETITVKNAKRNREEKAKFRIDPSRAPKHLDLTPLDREGKAQATLPGIYALDGDTLKLCLTEGDASKRPGDFESKEGSNRILIELKREK
jgi:uncharacterized protein (TIGR03067 family)